MGLLGGGNSRAERLAKNAKGESVTSGRLTAEKRGFGKGRDYLANSSVLDWLDEEEQPHFIFPSQGGAHHIKKQVASDLVPNGEYRTITVITTEEILFLIGDDDGDKSHTVQYEEVSGVGYDTTEPPEDSSILSTSVTTLKIEVEDEAFFVQSSLFEDDIELAASYILNKSNICERIQSDFESPNTEAHDAVERYNKRLEQATNKPNNNSPKPNYSGRGGKVRIEGNTKQRENCGGVEVYDDKIKVQKKGMINRSWITIPISEIQSVDSTAFGKVSIITEANDYTISGCSIATQLVNYVNKWEDGSKDEIQGDAVSAAEEIKKFAELNDEGIISDEEFEKKKDELL